jgi:hypothetical protein
LRPDGDEDRCLEADEWVRHKYAYGEQLQALGVEIQNLDT